MAPSTDHTTRIPSGVASPVTTNHAAKGSVFVNLRNTGNLKIGFGVWGQDRSDLQRLANRVPGVGVECLGVSGEGVGWFRVEGSGLRIWG